jgi:hypothetical protein
MFGLFGSRVTLSGVALLGAWIVILGVFLTCEGPVSPPRQDSPNQVVSSPTGLSLRLQDSTDLATRLQNSKEVKELTEIWQSLRVRALSSGMSWKDLKSASQHYDEVTLRKSLRLSSQEEDSLTRRLLKLGNSLQSQFPELQSSVAQSRPCVDCATVLGDTGDVQGGGTPPPQPGCWWVQYSASVILCSATGPFFYWPCAYVAYCGLCWGSVHDSICY